MGREGPGQRPAGDRLHHRRLDFEIAARIEEPAHVREHPAADVEHAPRIGIDDEIEVALSVADLDVAQAVPLFRQWQETLDQKLELRHVDRQLVGPRAEQVSFDTDEIAEVEQFEDLKVTLADRVLADVGLDLRLAVRNRDEVGLAEAADRQDAARGPGLDALGGELVGCPGAVERHQLRTVCVRSNACGYGSTPRRWSASKLARRCATWSDSLCSDSDMVVWESRTPAMPSEPRPGRR